MTDKEKVYMRRHEKNGTVIVSNGYKENKENKENVEAILPSKLNIEHVARAQLMEINTRHEDFDDTSDSAILQGQWVMHFPKSSEALDTAWLAVQKGITENLFLEAKVDLTPFENDGISYQTLVITTADFKNLDTVYKTLQQLESFGIERKYIKGYKRSDLLEPGNLSTLIYQPNWTKDSNETIAGMNCAITLENIETVLKEYDPSSNEAIIANKLLETIKIMLIGLQKVEIGAMESIIDIECTKMINHIQTVIQEGNIGSRGLAYFNHLIGHIEKILKLSTDSQATSKQLLAALSAFEQSARGYVSEWNKVKHAVIAFTGVIVGYAALIAAGAWIATSAGALSNPLEIINTFSDVLTGGFPGAWAIKILVAILVILISATIYTAFTHLNNQAKTVFPGAEKLLETHASIVSAISSNGEAAITLAIEETDRTVSSIASSSSLGFFGSTDNEGSPNGPTNEDESTKNSRSSSR